MEEKQPSSFIDVRPDSHFPIQNLPYAVFRSGSDSSTRVGVAIGDWVLDLAVIQEQGLFDGPYLGHSTVFTQPTLNAFMTLGRPAWSEARATIKQLLDVKQPTLRDAPLLRQRALLPMGDVQLLLPAKIGDYTDFYSSREHASNVGRMFRGQENALLPNWLHLPVAYHGRSSSVVISGQDIIRPQGQVKSATAADPHFAASSQLDFELEMGYFIGPGNPLGQPIPIHEAADHIFGLVLVNDWSARDIQSWEYRPLGPFLAKNFATSISPWIVTLDALEPFRCAGPSQDPEPMAYLHNPGNWAYDIQLEVQLQTEQMRQSATISRSNMRHLYWQIEQQLAHHTITGCNLRPGDLLASGTISGPTPASYGSLLELTWRGTRPIQLPNGQTRRFLEDGDRLTLTGWCQGEDYRIGFGEVTARIHPAIDLSYNQ